MLFWKMARTAGGMTTPSLGRLSLATWSTHAILETDVARLPRKEAKVRALVAWCSVEFVQDAHCGAMLHMGLTSDLGGALHNTRLDHSSARVRRDDL